MKITNTALETTASETVCIATKVRTEKWEGRTGMDTSTLECVDMAAITSMFANNKERGYVVTNLATGEKRTYDGNELREWLATQSLDTMVTYRIAFAVVWDKASMHGRGEITHEVSFARVNRSDVLTDAARNTRGNNYDVTFTGDKSSLASLMETVQDALSKDSDTAGMSVYDLELDTLGLDCIYYFNHSSFEWEGRNRFAPDYMHIVTQMKKMGFEFDNSIDADVNDGIWFYRDAPDGVYTRVLVVLAETALEAYKEYTA